MNRKYTEEQIQFLRDNSEGLNSTELTNAYNQRFNTDLPISIITSMRYRLGLNSGIDGSIRKGERRSPETEFKKGQVSWNKGKKGILKANRTSFQIGQKPNNMHPVGTVMMRSDGYLWIKVKEMIPSRFGWRQVHLRNWEQTHGEIPAGHKVIFLDGDRNNCDISNLMMITDAQLATINKHNLIKKDPELTKTGVIIAELISKTYRMQRSSKRNQVQS